MLGGDAARTGPIGHDQLTFLETTVSGQGAVYFYWKASTEEWVDYLDFFVDGDYVMSISGQEGWWQGYRYLDTGGDHTLTWVYEKDEEDIEGDDAAWVDGFSFIPGPPAPVPARGPASR